MRVILADCLSCEACGEKIYSTGKSVTARCGNMDCELYDKVFYIPMIEVEDA